MEAKARIDPKDLMPLEKVCAYCAHFKWKSRDRGGWAYCLLNQTWHPGQKSEGINPAGLRSCDDWKHMAYRKVLYEQEELA